MHGTILVIDPIATNRIALRVKLAACHYDVRLADSIADAMPQVAQAMPDMILTSTALPDGDGVRLLARLRAAGCTGKVPVIALSGPLPPDERLALLAAGFDDVIARPLDDGLLIARTRCLIRAYASAQEWRLRDDTSRALGFAEDTSHFGAAQRILLVCDDAGGAEGRLFALRAHLAVPVARATPSAVFAEDRAADAFVLMANSECGFDALSLLAAIRSHAGSRHSVVLVVQAQPDPVLAAQMLDIGADDVVGKDADPAELALRLEKLLARKQLSDALRDTVRSGVEAAMIDPLTGLHNRRYAMPHLTRIAERSQRSGRPFAVMVADLDHFKRINDRYGHAVGDAVLVEVAHRLRDNVRAVDMVARIGGEEFLIVLPGIEPAGAKVAAARLCDAVRNHPVPVPHVLDPVRATISIGLALCDAVPAELADAVTDLTANGLLDRADRALYSAKAKGRNRVMLDRSAA